jgi:hypothetical protein
MHTPQQGKPSRANVGEQQVTITFKLRRKDAASFRALVQGWRDHTANQMSASGTYPAEDAAVRAHLAVTALSVQLNRLAEADPAYAY